VTNQTPLKDNWKEFLNTIAIIKVEFLESFGLPLNASINTEKGFPVLANLHTNVVSMPHSYRYANGNFCIK
jgi:hypothetical protein